MLIAQAEVEGLTDIRHMPMVHSVMSEDIAFRRVMRLARYVEGAAIYMVHVSAAPGVDAIAEARADGLPVYGETLHQYLLYTSEDYRRPNGQIYHTYPSLKSRRDQESLWAGLQNGHLHSVATDEVCCNLSVKVRGKRIDDTTGGNSGVEPRVAVIYTETVEKRGYPLEKFVDVVSSNAARILGLYPRKGAIAVGSDADIVVLDTSRRRTVRAQDLHESDYTPWEGKEVAAWPSVTVLRGKVMVADGKFYGDLKDGRYLKRKISPEILARRSG